MKTIMIIIGWVLLIPFVILELIVKIIWCVIFSVFKPVFLSTISNDYKYWNLYDYAYKFKGNMKFCNWLINLWD